MIKSVILGPGFSSPYAVSTTDNKKCYNNTQQGSTNWSNNHSSNIRPMYINKHFVLNNIIIILYDNVCM